jgi:hypothetical protein
MGETRLGQVDRRAAGAPDYLTQRSAGCLFDPNRAVSVPREKAILSVDEASLRCVPLEAYLAADDVLDCDLDDRDTDPRAVDELWLGLRAAAPHIRLDEIDRLLDVVRGCDSVTDVIVALQEQRNLLERVSNGATRWSPPSSTTRSGSTSARRGSGRGPASYDVQHEEHVRGRLPGVA